MEIAKRPEGEIAKHPEQEMNSRQEKRRRAADLARHKKKCTICHHPDRLLIEDDFVHWRSMFRMRHEWGINDRSSIYRHARAFGLMEQRRRNLRWSLEYILERSEECKVTGGSIVQAAKLYAQISDNGEIIDRPKRVVVSHEMVSHEMLPAPAPPLEMPARELPSPTEPELIPPRQNLLPGSSEPLESGEILIATPNERQNDVND